MDGDIELMQVLLEFGANPKAKDGVRNVIIIYENNSKQHQEISIVKIKNIMF